MTGPPRAVADVDLGAVRDNVATLIEAIAPAEVCAVVKADGYGHGAVPVARAALDAGATWLAVAFAFEGVALRAAGIDAPVLVLSEPEPEAWTGVVEAALTPTLYTAAGIAGMAGAAATAGGPEPVAVHLKIDTGMHRVGAAPIDALARAKAIRARPELALQGLWTHCAVADEPGHPATPAQLECFEAVLAELAAAGIQAPLVHAANSAAALDRPETRYDMVRCGITVYGLAPSPALAGRVPLRPALSLRSRVAFTKVVPAGDAVSYGLRHTVTVDTVIATVPVGYADGIPRRYSTVGGEVLVGGRACPVVGTVTMDQILVDLGPPHDRTPQVGDEVVLIGSQGGEVITADDWAARLGTISYEVVCAISSRVPRSYTG